MDSRSTRPTTAAPGPFDDGRNSPSTGSVGPSLLQDWQLLDRLARQNRERIPERVVHAKGCGAFGTFTVTNDISHCTHAHLFGKVGRTTETLTRFSTVAGERGAADAERDVRGFAVKFYTEEGNWDLVANNTPVFYIRDPLKFPHLVRAQKRQRRTNLRSNAAVWDFWSQSPESLHQVTFLMSDRGIPSSPRFMNGYGGHAFSFRNAAGERWWVKFHLKSQQGHRHLTNAGAAHAIGLTRDSYQQDLYSALDRGDYPRWTLSVQLMPEGQARTLPYDPFDLTKVWPHADYPLSEVGVLELNRNADDHFAQIEQAAFSPSHVVPGIGFSPDKVLQARLFAYADAQRYRLGTHYETLPVNAPKGPAIQRQQDAAMRADGPGGSDALGEADSVGDPTPASEYREPPLRLPEAADGFEPRAAGDDHSQAGALFRLFNQAQRQRLAFNIADSMEGVPRAIVERQLAHFRRADPQYAELVRSALEPR